MERIQLQFWPWKSQHFVNSSMTLRPCVQDLPPHPNWFNYFLTFSTFFVCQNFPDHFASSVFKKSFGEARSGGLQHRSLCLSTGSQLARPFQGHGILVQSFFAWKDQKKRWITDSTSSTLTTYLNLLNLPNLFNCSIFCHKMLWNLKCIWSYLIPISGVGKFPVGGVMLWEEKKCPSDPSTILPWFLCLLVLGGVSPLFILLPSWDDEICGWDLNPYSKPFAAVQVPWNCRFLSVDVA